MNSSSDLDGQVFDSSVYAGPKFARLWVPEEIKENAKVYILAGSHSGDMYHVRGAMSLERHQLIVHSCDDTTMDLTAYLRKTAPFAFVTKLKWHELEGDSKPDHARPLYKRNIELISEGQASRIIRNRVTDPAQYNALTAGMIQIDDTAKDDIKKVLVDLCRDLFGGEPNEQKKTVLVMYRDTGASKKDGAYPELDSGDEAIDQISSYVEEVPSAQGRSLDVVICGSEDDAFPNLRSIGQYFIEVNEACKTWLSGRTPQTKRDIQAFFLEIAYQLGYFHMAAGFRSGALDLFTFLGIPTVSISARQMVGEERHALFANSTFLRFNLQYERPRQICTKYFASSKEHNRGRLYLGSPWWAFGNKRDPTDKQQLARKVPPRGFENFDAEIVRTGLFHAICVLLPWEAGVEVLPVGLSRVFCNSTCRPCYLSSMDEGAKQNYFDQMRTKEEKDFKDREQALSETEETWEDFEKCRLEMENQWDDIQGWTG